MTWWRRPYLWAGASAVAVLVANIGGLAIGDDGVGYQATADHLLSGKGLGYFLEPRLTIWPPGWPLLMAGLARITPLDSEQAAVALNAITAFLVVVLTHRLLVRVIRRNDELVLLGTVVAALGTSSMVFGHLLMTDFAFAAVTFALLLALMNYRRTDALGWIVAVVVLVWAGFMIRYAGIVHIGTVGLWFLTDRRHPWWVRLRLAGLVGVLAGLVPALWIFRNLATDHTALGVRYSSSRGLLGNTFDILATIGNFLLPGVAIETRTVWAAVAFAGVAVMVFMLWRVVSRDVWVRSTDGWFDLFASETGLLVIHITVYLAYMLYARTTTGLNRLDFRLLNPVYLPLVITALAILDRAKTPVAIKTARVWAGLNVVVGLGMIGYFATSPDLFVGNYERAAFDTARASTALTAIPRGCDVSSNLPNALYGSGVEALWSPRKTGLESNDPVDDLDQLADDLDRHDHCLVWVDLEPRYGHLATLAELRKRFDLVELAADNGVTVYQFENK